LPLHAYGIAEALQGCGKILGRTVINNENLQWLPCLRQATLNGFDQYRGAVERRNEDCHQRAKHRLIRRQQMTEPACMIEALCTNGTEVGLSRPANKIEKLPQVPYGRGASAFPSDQVCRPFPCGAPFRRPCQQFVARGTARAFKSGPSGINDIEQEG
jgi:hypothetical protein